MWCFTEKSQCAINWLSIKRALPWGATDVLSYVKGLLKWRHIRTTFIYDLNCLHVHLQYWLLSCKSQQTCNTHALHAPQSYINMLWKSSQLCDFQHAACVALCTDLYGAIGCLISMSMGGDGVRRLTASLLMTRGLRLGWGRGCGGGVGHAPTPSNL